MKRVLDAKALENRIGLGILHGERVLVDSVVSQKVVEIHALFSMTSKTINRRTLARLRITIAGTA
jgi:hypothetical protein